MIGVNNGYHDNALFLSVSFFYCSIVSLVIVINHIILFRRMCKKQQDKKLSQINIIKVGFHFNDHFGLYRSFEVKIKFYFLYLMLYHFEFIVYGIF
jgi:hypothetical protein